MEEKLGIQINEERAKGSIEMTETPKIRARSKTVGSTPSSSPKNTRTSTKGRSGSFKKDKKTRSVEKLVESDTELDIELMKYKQQLEEAAEKVKALERDKRRREREKRKSKIDLEEEDEEVEHNLKKSLSTPNLAELMQGEPLEPPILVKEEEKLPKSHIKNKHNRSRSDFGINEEKASGSKKGKSRVNFEVTEESERQEIVKVRFKKLYFKITFCRKH
jgi:hypothetical protein